MTSGPRCSKCGAKILWVATKNGKMQPLDAIPNEAGNIRLTANYRMTERGALQESAVIPKDVAPTLFGDPVVRYMPHHATCPYADEFRAKKVRAS